MSQADIDETETSSLPWPSLSDRVFVKAPPFSGAWVANRADERLFRMIKGFQESGDLLVSESEAEPRRAQNLDDRFHETCVMERMVWWRIPCLRLTDEERDHGRMAASGRIDDDRRND
jgi:hypothetical protein